MGLIEVLHSAHPGESREPVIEARRSDGVRRALNLSAFVSRRNRGPALAGMSGSEGDL